jgi:hypothetical protein
VAGRYDLEEFPAGKTRLVFIGQHLNEAREAILEQLSKCET